MWRHVFVYFPLFRQFLQLHGQHHPEENEDKTSRIFDSSRATHIRPDVTVRRLQQIRPQNVQFCWTVTYLYLFRSTGSPSVRLAALRSAHSAFKAEPLECPLHWALSWKLSIRLEKGDISNVSSGLSIVMCAWRWLQRGGYYEQQLFFIDVCCEPAVSYN
jgi:hypothetical protein